ncbi:unnamed protein product [Vicia faba]|uniref:RING-type E3 ubiquitin transferase n=1 Tax=Vicia faba TaxID=3906 RepID=A0AAV1AYB3_VICFA|nr:unnamed protein product [Vicia faba]
MFPEPVLKKEYGIIGKDVIGTFILLFILFLAILRIYFYLRHLPRQSLISSNSLPTPTFTEERLDPSVLKSLPIFTYSSSAVRRTLHDCAICLSEYADGDECRMLPNCDHVFHSQCIDAWFASHSNCPLCRAPVQPVTVESRVEPGEGSLYFPEPIGCPRRPFRVIIDMQPEVFRMESHTRG